MKCDVNKENQSMEDIYRKLDEAEVDISEGNVMDGMDSINTLRDKYDV